MPSTLSSALAADVDAGFEELVVTFQDGLYVFASSLAGDFARGQDIVQEAFVRAYRALKRYDSERILVLALRPWLYQITLNVFKNTLRGRDRELTLLAELPERADEAAGPEVLAMRCLEREHLVLALGTLPAQYRAAIVLRHVRDLPYQEISAIVGQPTGTVKSNVHRGLEMLRRSYLQEVS